MYIKPIAVTASHLLQLLPEQLGRHDGVDALPPLHLPHVLLDVDRPRDLFK